MGPSKAKPAPEGRWETVLFVDLDATIIRGPFESAVFPVVFGELAQKTGLAQADIRRQVMVENLARLRDPAVPAARAMDWDDIFEAVARRLGVGLEASGVAIAAAHAGPPYTAILDHADQILRQLVRPGRAIVIATKGLRKYQLPVLDALGLTPLCTGILTPDLQGALKGDPAFYDPWPRITRVQISFGDLYDDDVLGPKRLGFKAIWKLNAPNGALQQAGPLDRPAGFPYAADQPVRPDAIVFSLSELPDVVEALERAPLAR